MLHKSITACCFALLFALPLFAADNSIDLSGQWRFALDSENRGQNERWFANGIKDDTITLPGTTDIAQKGSPNTEKLTQQLTRRYKYVGKAWYQRDIEIPEDWKGRRIVLTLERTKATTVWFDDSQVGQPQFSLSTPHRHVLTTDAVPGKHTLTILVDNNPKLFPAGGHMIDEDIQTNWNGVVGDISLKSTSSQIWIEKVQVRTHTKPKTAAMVITLRKAGNETPKGEIRIGRFNAPFLLEAETETYCMPEVPAEKRRLWSEWTPGAEPWKVSIETDSGICDSQKVRFAVHQFSHNGKQILCNGDPVFLRGKNDALTFPLTGVPPMDKEAWIKYLMTCKNFGINHLRFHSCCPPEAAFAAADELGIYIQAENPARGEFGGNKERDDYQIAEAKAILDEYGNHPSFCIFSLGNELGDDRQKLEKTVAELREYDGNRRLYTAGSNNWFWDPQQLPGDDLWITMRTLKGSEGNVRASFSHADLPLGHIEVGPPNTLHNFSKALEKTTLPVIGHEVGQYQVFPNFDEMSRYTGVLEARNFEVFRERLDKAGMLDQWKDFFDASLELTILCYKEDIEAALRTEHFGGFQLLDLQDFQAQGTALVGVFNAFMEPKSKDLQERWTQFCNPVVPLALLDKYVWTEGESFMPKLKVANFGAKKLEVKIYSTLTGKHFSEKDARMTNRMSSGFILPKGALSGVRSFCGYPQTGAKLTLKDGKPEKMTLTVTATEVKELPPGTGMELTLWATSGNKVAENSWDIWVYPNHTDDELQKLSEGILVTQSIDEKATTALDDGKTVLLLNKPTETENVADRQASAAEAMQSIGGVADKLAPQEIQQNEKRIKGLFMTDFWCYPMFRGITDSQKREPSPGTLGILCDPKHPIFDEFPTDSHTNWNWWHLIKNSNNLILDDTSQEYRPIVQVIDNFARNHKIGMIFESKAGKTGAGKLLVCCIDENTLPSPLYYF
ncbi:beta-galactosidase [Planctomycetales bacterium]|nr:beta-galactosidase [Planctomycetales bacterium]